MRRVVVAVLVSVLLVLPAGAQNPNAPDPSSAANILYAASDSADNRDNGWLTTDPEPGTTGTVGGGKPEECEVPGSEGNDLPSPLCEWPAFEWTWTYTMSPALRSPVQLEAGGKIKLTAYLGAGTGEGTLSVTTKLAQGGAVIVEGAATAHEYANSPSGANYGSVVWEVPVTVATLEAGKPLVWTVTAAGEEGGTGSLFMAVGEPRGRSNIELPVGGAAPRALSGATVDLLETFNATTNGTLQYTWVGPATSQAVSYRTNGTGNVTITIKDGANATIFEQTVVGAGEGNKVVTGAAGNWSIAIRLGSFNGTVGLAIGPSAAPGQGTTGSGLGNATGGADADGNASADDAKDNGAPAPALPLLAAAIVALAAFVRRRT